MQKSERNESYPLFADKSLRNRTVRDRERSGMIRTSDGFQCCERFKEKKGKAEPFLSQSFKFLIIFNLELSTSLDLNCRLNLHVYVSFSFLIVLVFLWLFASFSFLAVDSEESCLALFSQWLNINDGRFSKLIIKCYTSESEAEGGSHVDRGVFAVCENLRLDAGKSMMLDFFVLTSLVCWLSIVLGRRHCSWLCNCSDPCRSPHDHWYLSCFGNWSSHSFHRCWITFFSLIHCCILVARKGKRLELLLLSFYQHSAFIFPVSDLFSAEDGHSHTWGRELSSESFAFHCRVCILLIYRHLPFFFTEAELEWLKGSIILSQLDSEHEEISADYMSLSASVPSFKAQQFSLDDWMWARATVFSRSFGFSMKGEKTEGLVPFADLWVHRVSVSLLYEINYVLLLFFSSLG